jgi:hypothetical protein
MVPSEAVSNEGPLQLPSLGVIATEQEGVNKGMTGAWNKEETRGLGTRKDAVFFLEMTFSNLIAQRPFDPVAGTEHATSEPHRSTSGAKIGVSSHLPVWPPVY